MTAAPPRAASAPCKHDSPRPAGCKWCALALTRDRRYLAAWWGLPADYCPHRGAATGERVPCAEGCGAGTALKVFECGVYGRCTLAKRGEGVPGRCKGCDILGADSGPLRTVRVDSAALAPGEAGARFNASLIRHRGRLLMAYRTGWAGAEVHVAEMAGDLTPCESVTLGLRHPLARYGREDPRLFEHRGRLHVAYIGVQGGKGGIATHQLYARLGDDLAVEEVFYPEYAHRNPWEKNWQFLSSFGELFAVYTIHPHRVLHVRGFTAYPFTEAAWTPRWSGGLLRGGAAPVLVGDEYYGWFHGVKDVGGVRTYTAGVYTFEAKPPFRPVRLTPEPLLAPDPADRPPDQWASCVFPCGAVLEGGRWLVSYGYMDREIRVAEFDAGAVERALVRV